ncbi:hypothetical protein CALCODRAFT_480793 [Calocera cornea HHB12733]|uniref:Uncharacterized protein n=1 Tax=Calocera cornea HHB12733 TaxID=1353952 RepID=A0A165I8S7_9BASI|nr:hypothetical protein CALCODRAFT_480793 [Calocera cornea HHB12733]
MPGIRALVPKRWSKKSKKTTTTTTTAASPSPAPAPTPTPTPAPAPTPAPGPSYAVPYGLGCTIPAGAFHRVNKGKKVAREPRILPDITVPSPAVLADSAVSAWAAEMVPMSTLAANELTAMQGGPSIKTEAEPVGKEEGADEQQEKKKPAAAGGEGARAGGGGEGSRWAGGMGETAAGVGGGAAAGGMGEGGAGARAAAPVGVGDGLRTPREVEGAESSQATIALTDPRPPLPDFWDFAPSEYFELDRDLARRGKRNGGVGVDYLYGGPAAFGRAGWVVLGQLWLHMHMWLPAIGGFFSAVWAYGFDFWAIVSCLFGCIVYVLFFCFALLWSVLKALWPYRNMIMFVIGICVFLYLAFHVNVVAICIGFLKGIPGWISTKSSAKPAA